MKSDARHGKMLVLQTRWGINMHCDNKKFQYSGEKKSNICLVEVSASVYGTTMTLNFPLDKKEDVVESLSKAKIPFKPTGLTSISIRTPLHQTANIKKSLEKLFRSYSQIWCMSIRRPHCLTAH